MFASLMLVGFALAQEVPFGSCKVDFKVACTDCQVGDEFKAEIYQFSADGTRMQVGYLPHMKSEESISSGNMTPGRRTLVIEDEEFITVECVGEKDFTYPVKILLHGEEVESEDAFIVESPVSPPRAFPAASANPPEPGRMIPEPVVAVIPPVTTVEPVNLPGYKPATAHPDPTPPDFEEEEAGDTGVLAEPPSAPQLAPLSKPAPEPTPPARVAVEEEEEDEGLVVAQPAGWGTPGGPALWLGNDGDYPSAPLASRQGHFTGAERHCPAGKIPLIQGTAAQIAGGIPRQVALDDRRATDVAPPDWNGEYVGPTGTTITGKDAAGIYCVEPSSIIRREPAAMAAVIQPAPPPGVTQEALQQALEDQAKKLREELKAPEEGSEPPATATSVPTPKAPLLTRGGPFTGVQWSVGQPNFHWLFGGFVTLRLSDRIWFEPWVAAGTDGKSTHPSGWDEERSVYTETTGTYVAISGGVSFPVVVWEGSQGLTLLLTPSLGWVGDDLTSGVTTWGDSFSAGAQAELWWGRKVPLAIYAEASVGANVWSNDQTQHQWAVRVPVKAGVKVPF